MTEVIEKPTTELIPLPPAETALQVFTVGNGLDPYLQQTRQAALEQLGDATAETPEGRKTIASVAYKVAQMKTGLDKIGKEESARQKEIPKKIDAERSRAWRILEALQHEIRQPLTEWEEAEKERISAHETNIANMRALLTGYDHQSSSELAARLYQIEAVKLGEHWQEYEVTAGRVKDEVSTALKQAYEKAKAHEEQQIELARLKAEAAAREQKEREERIAAEAARQARKDAEDKAAAEKARLQLEAERAKRKEQEAKAAAEKAKKESEEKAERAVAAERERMAKEQEKAEAEAKKREANARHRKKIIGEAAKALEETAGIDQETAELIVSLIAAGEVPHISINF